MIAIPKELWHILYVVALAFLVGLELKTYRLAKLEKHEEPHIGSTRTFTFIGLLGYIFYVIDIYLFIVGYVALVAVYLSYYLYKLHQDRTSIISFLLMSLVYSLGALMENFDIWMPTLVFVLIVFVLGANRSLRYLLGAINIQEFETLGKFLLLSAVILPLLPHRELPYLHISAFKIWLVVVVISAISYGSYIAQKYIFKSRGYLLAGILGGLYSSTATTVVLAKKAASGGNMRIIDAAIIVATAMMYMRLLLIAAIFNQKVAAKLALPMLLFAVMGISIAFFYYRKEQNTKEAPIDDRNPLELGTALLFAALFVAMIFVTDFVTSHYGNIGLKILSFLIGFTDIDPFVLSLLTGKYTITTTQIATAILIASGSNNILKALYALIFGKGLPKHAALWLLVLGVVTIFSPYLFYKGI